MQSLEPQIDNRLASASSSDDVVAKVVTKYSVISAAVKVSRVMLKFHVCRGTAFDFQCQGQFLVYASQLQ